MKAREMGTRRHLYWARKLLFPVLHKKFLLREICVASPEFLFFKEKLFQFSIFHYSMSLVPNFERFGEFPFVHLKFNLFWLWSEGQQMEVNI
jgi:hypothetical protein